MDTLTCNSCHTEKSASEFYKHKNSRTGYYSSCKSCCNERNKKWRHEHPEKVAEYMAHYVENNTKEEKEIPQFLTCAKCKEEKPISEFSPNLYSPTLHHTQCRSCRAAQSSAYHETHREEQNKKKREHRNNHLEEAHQRGAAWQQNNPEKTRAANKRYYRRFPEKAQQRCAKRRAVKNNAPVVEQIDREIIFERDNWLCQICVVQGKPLKECKVKREDASIDHIIPLSKGGEESYRNCVLTHIYCNLSKGNRTVLQQQRLF